MIDGTGEVEWIKDSEKFAIIGLSVTADPAIERIEISDRVFVLGGQAFDLPNHWQEWLGTMRVEDVRNCNLFLVANMPSTAPEVLDAENQHLQAIVGHWFMGLLLERSFALDDEPFAATGSSVNGEIDIRSFGRLDPPARTVIEDLRPITEDQLRRASLVGDRLGAYDGPWRKVDWRLLRCLEIYRIARNDNNILDRIHQFTRCIEGLILPKQGETKRQFKSRTELFVGPSHHNLMGEIYDVRSDVEHLHEYKHLEARDRLTRIRLAELEAIVEFVARSCLARIIVDPLLAGYFGGVADLAEFWGKHKDERRAIWGDPIDPLAVLSGFSFDHVSDMELGVRRNPTY